MANLVRSQPNRSSRSGAIMLASLLLFAALAVSTRPTHAGNLPCSVQYGVYDTNTPWDPSETAIKNLDAAVNRHSSIVHWFAQWGDPGAGNFSANQPWMLSNVRAYSSVGVTGSTPFITWEPWGPAPYTAANNTFPLQQIAAGTCDPYNDSWANGLHTYGGLVLLDFGHEMDGNWFPWGYAVNGNTPADFISAYRHVHDRFALAGATNVQFVWTANVWNPSYVDQRVFYPGDAYVDWLAIDVFNWGANGGGWASLSQGLADTGIYSRVASLNATKPMMLGEWASAEAPTLGSPRSSGSTRPEARSRSTRRLRRWRRRTPPSADAEPTSVGRLAHAVGASPVSGGTRGVAQRRAPIPRLRGQRLRSAAEESDGPTHRGSYLPKRNPPGPSAPRSVTVAPADGPRTRPARLCLIRQGYYPLDPRVRREVDALAQAGHEVDVICLRRPGEKRLESQGHVTAHRVPIPTRRAGRFNYVIQYAAFFAVASVLVAVLHLRRRFDVVQVNSMPDSLVFAAIVPRLLGARVLLDLHECMPEFYAVKFGVGLRHPAVRFVAWMEQAAIRFADQVI